MVQNCLVEHDNSLSVSQITTFLYRGGCHAVSLRNAHPRIALNVARMPAETTVFESKMTISLIHNYRKIKSTSVVILSMVCTVMLSLALTPVYAQSEDATAPLISLEEIDQGFVGETQVFTATVTDDVALASVVLFHRLTGDQTFVASTMTELGSSNIYSASVEISSTAASDIEYYIQAEDLGGNKSLSGFSFDPLVRDIVINEGAVATTGAITTGLSRNQKILYGVLGILAVGLLASQAGGSSGGGGGTTTMDIPVDITVNPL